MALPTIAINSSTGSDTLASGAGPSVALTGSLAATHANTTVNITDAVNLSGVAVDGSAVLWVSSSSGKQWAKITAISGTSGNWTVTVSDAYANTESGRSWAIGGKRATLASSLQLGTDCRGGWTIDVQDNQTLTANFNLKPNSVANTWTTFTSTTTTRPIISTSTNSIYGLDIQGANNLVVSHLSFRSTAGTPGNGISPAAASGASYILVSDCVVDGFVNGIQDHDNGGNVDVLGMIINDTEVKTCTTSGINLWAGCQLCNCYVHGCTGDGLKGSATRQRGYNLTNCVFDNNKTTGANIVTNSQVGVLIKNCNFTNTVLNVSTGAGLVLNMNSAATVTIENSIFYGNTTYGIATAGGNLSALVMRNNAFGANTTADVQAPVTTGTSPVTLTANPFVSSTDFSLNLTSGGGTACRRAGQSQSIFSATANSPDIGAVQAGIIPVSSGVAKQVFNLFLMPLSKTLQEP